jgi:PDGLE domain
MTRNVKLVLIAVAIIAVVGIGLSQLASSQPDGLEFVAESEGFGSQAASHSLENTPLADYGGDDRGLTVVAAIFGIAVTLAAGYAVFALVGSKSDPAPKEH